MRFSKLLAPALTLAVAALVWQAAQWHETELPHGYCFDYAGVPANCVPKSEHIFTPIVTPVVTLTAVPATVAATVAATPTVSPTPPPTDTRTPVPPTSAPAALLNPSFENGATSWAVYIVSGNPEWNIESLAAGADPRAVLDGEKSLRFIVPGNYGVWRAGAFQRVRVGAGRMVTFSVSAYFKAGTASGLDENRIREIASHFDVGIDPAGGQSRDAAGIVWNRGGGDYQWQTRTVTAQALGEWVTVFVEAGVGGEWSFPWSMVFVDAATLR